MLSEEMSSSCATSATNATAVGRLACKRIQVDELWGFVHAKQKNVLAAKKAPVSTGDVWLWVATDAAPS